MDIDLAPGTHCILTLEQADETDEEIIELLSLAGINQYTLTWKVSTKAGEVFSYRAEVLPTQEVELKQKHLTGLLYIPENQTTFHPNHLAQLWTRYCSIAQELRNQGLELRTFFEYQGKRTELFPPTPLHSDNRLYVNQSLPENTLETIAQVL